MTRDGPPAWHRGALLKALVRFIDGDTSRAITDEQHWATIIADAGLTADEASHALYILGQTQLVTYEAATQTVRVTAEGVEWSGRFV
jgi:hypothetical protein